MPDWIFWAVFGWLLFAVVGRRWAHVGCGKGGRGHRAAFERRACRRKALPDTGTADLPPRVPSSEELEQRLRARFVADELSVEEYERELDRLYRRG